MKKLIYCAAALATALFAGSCQQELLETTAGENTVTYTVAIPSALTKASAEDHVARIGDGSNVDQLIYEVWKTGEADQTDLYNDAVCLYQEETSLIKGENGERKAVITLNLVQDQEYTILFWAQVRGTGNYTTSDLRNVRYAKNIRSEYNSNVEDYAAFYAVDFVSDSDPKSKKVSLTRPFAQLNLGTLNTADKYTVAMVESEVSVKGVPTGFNVAEKKALGEGNVKFNYYAVPQYPDSEIEVSGKLYQYAAMNYIFADNQKRTTTVTYNIKTKVTSGAGVNNEVVTENVVVNNTIDYVPLQENYRTNIVGNLLTSTTQYEVVVNADWAGADLAPDPIYMAAANGGDVTLDADVTLEQPLDIKADMTLDLNGKTITGALNVAPGANVTIENGSITNGDKTVSGITTNGILTLNNVTIESARHAVRVESGKVVINGGTYKVAPVSNSTLHALNVGDDNTKAEVIIKGGTFIGPKGTMADSGSAVKVRTGSKVVIEGGDFSGGKTKTVSCDGEMTITGGSFDQDPEAYVAEGYKAVEKDAVFHVVDANTTVVANAEELATAISTGQDIKLASNIETSEQITITGAQTRSVIASVTIDGNGKTLTYTGSGASARAIDVPATANGINVTVKNLTIDCTSSYCQRGINYNTNGKLVLDNVTVQGQNVTYAINLPGSSDNANVEIKNSSLTGNIALNVWGENAMITATDSHFTSVDNAIHENYSAIVLNNDGSSIADGAIINIIGGTITALDENGEPSNAIRNSTNTGIVNVSETTVVIGKQIEPVAIIYYEGYSEFYSCETLQRAINKVCEDNNGSVRLIKDITVEEPITIPADGTVAIDLNGKRITGTIHKSVGHVVKNDGTLTIKNGTVSSTANNGGSALMNTGTLTVENVTLNGAPNADGSWPSYTVNNTGVATITNTTITSFHGAVASYKENALITLNDSEIDMAGIPGFTNHGIYTYDGGAVVVNGGTYANNATDQASTGGSVINGAVTVNAGTFSGRIENYYGTPVIKGGTFTVEPKAKFVPAEYKVVKNENNTWSVYSVSYYCETVKNPEGVRYEGDHFGSGYMENALWFNNNTFGGEAAIVVEKKKYNAIIIENCSGTFKNDVFTINNAYEDVPVILFENLDLTIADGKKLINSAITIHQVFMANITINGEKMTQETVAKYLENVEWYQVVE